MTLGHKNKEKDIYQKEPSELHFFPPFKPNKKKSLGRERITKFEFPYHSSYRPASPPLQPENKNIKIL